MKNSLKIGGLAIAIAVSFAACKGAGSKGSSDSDTTKKADTAMTKMADTSKKADTGKMKMADTSKKMKDTTKKK
jgi:hypothetical protein